MANKTASVLVHCTSAAKLPQSRAGTLYNKIKKCLWMQASNTFPDFVVQCTLKTAYTKHLEYVKRKDRDENEALY